MTLAPAPLVPARLPLPSPGPSEASRVSASPPGGDDNYSLADLHSIYRDQDQDQDMPPPEAHAAFGGSVYTRNDSSDNEDEDVEVEKLSPEHYAQANLSQDSLDVILPPQMLNSNMFDIPDFAENFLENLNDEDLNDADEPPASQGNIAPGTSNQSRATENDAPEVEEEQNQPEENQPEPNNAPNAPELILPNRPPAYRLQLPADNMLGPNIFDEDSNDQNEPNIYDEERPALNVMELNIFEPNLFGMDYGQHNLLEPNIFDDDRPELNLRDRNILEPIILEPNLINADRFELNEPLQNGLAHNGVDNDDDRN